MSKPRQQNHTTTTEDLAPARYSVTNAISSDRETMRRLLIQNKKLIEQVSRQKELIRKIKTDQKLALNHLKEVIKLITS